MEAIKRRWTIFHKARVAQRKFPSTLPSYLVLVAPWSLKQRSARFVQERIANDKQYSVLFNSYHLWWLEKSIIFSNAYVWKINVQSQLEKMDEKMTTIKYDFYD